MLHTSIGSLPKHQYIYVDTHFTHKEPQGWMPAVWFGLVAFPARAWGLNVLLENGAIYRNLPPHSVAFCVQPEKKWTIQQAQTWDCYGASFSCHEYAYLAGLDCAARLADGSIHEGSYLFTVAPTGDGFTAYPEQAKEFTFVKLENGRLTVQPTNHTLFREKSFTDAEYKWPKGLRRQLEVWSAE